MLEQTYMRMKILLPLWLFALRLYCRLAGAAQRTAENNQLWLARNEVAVCLNSWVRNDFIFHILYYDFIFPSVLFQCFAIPPVLCRIAPLFGGVPLFRSCSGVLYSIVPCSGVPGFIVCRKIDVYWKNVLQWIPKINESTTFVLTSVFCFCYT